MADILNLIAHMVFALFELHVLVCWCIFPAYKIPGIFTLMVCSPGSPTYTVSVLTLLSQ